MRRVFAGLLAIVFLGAALAPPVRAFPLTGCTLTVSSTDARGEALDSATSGDRVGTLEDPFSVDFAGTVHYEGTTETLIKNHRHQVSVYGIPIPTLTGSDPNEGEETEGFDDLTLAGAASFRVTGLYFVSGFLVGDGGSCSGSGWVRLEGDPLANPLFWLAVVITLVGLALVAASLPERRPEGAGAVKERHPFRGFFGGLLLGLGVALLLVFVGFVPMGELTPWVMIGLGIAVGLAVALAGPTRGRRIPTQPVVVERR
jgi:hypothetical protein